MIGFKVFDQKRSLVIGFLATVFGIVIVAYPGVFVQLFAIIYGLHTFFFSFLRPTK